MYKEELLPFAPATYLMPKKGRMKVPGLIFASNPLLSLSEMEKPLEQVAHVAELQGIIGYSIAMPDIHWGYGFPIGGIAATDIESGVISPGGVGYDINCGVRVALPSISFKEISDSKKEKLLNAIFRSVPSGIGHGNDKKKLSRADYELLTREGARWSVEQGMGIAADLSHTESFGCLPGASLDSISELAFDRGAAQLGSIGSGNHFIEIGWIEKLFLPEIAEKWGVKEGNAYVLIHSGSRGFGHQVCQDSLDALMSAGFAKGLPDKQLVAAPFKSPEGQRYFSQMNSAANYAFNNRQQILHHVRRSFHEILGLKDSEIPLLYDVCHNIAKVEMHQGKKLCVHRKGATRAYGPKHPELPPLFQETGQPVLPVIASL